MRELSVVSGCLTLYSLRSLVRGLRWRWIIAWKHAALVDRARFLGASESGLARTSANRGGKAGRSYDATEALGVR